MKPGPATASAPRDAALAAPAPRFAICTLVSDRAHYRALCESFRAGGFDGDCEYLYLDNSDGGGWDAYRGIPRLIAASRARYLILCHQDVRLLEHGRDDLDARLAELDRLDADWALAGNAGGTPCGAIALRISDPFGEDRRRAALPARASSLDENFIVLRRDAPVGLSADLEGFHLYGADLCLHARLSGRSAWVIDFHLRHLSPGRTDAAFRDCQNRFERKYGALFGQNLTIRTTCTRLHLAGSWLGRLRGWLRQRRRLMRLHR